MDVRARLLQRGSRFRPHHLDGFVPAEVQIGEEDLKVGPRCRRRLGIAHFRTPVVAVVMDALTQLRHLVEVLVHALAIVDETLQSLLDLPFVALFRLFGDIRQDVEHVGGPGESHVPNIQHIQAFLVLLLFVCWLEIRELHLLLVRHVTALAGDGIGDPIAGGLAVGGGCSQRDDHRELHSLRAVDGHQLDSAGGIRQRKPRNGLFVTVDVVPPNQEVGHRTDVRLRVFVHQVEEVGHERVRVSVKLVKTDDVLHRDDKGILVPVVHRLQKTLNTKLLLHQRDERGALVLIDELVESLMMLAGEILQYDGLRQGVLTIEQEPQRTDYQVDIRIVDKL